MTAYNAVRFLVKPGREKEFIDGHRDIQSIPGMHEASLIKTGDRAYCFIGKWESMEKLAAARPQMIGILDKFRGLLEDQGNGRGVTDPVSGDVVLDLMARK